MTCCPAIKSQIEVVEFGGQR